MRKEPGQQPDSHDRLPYATDEIAIPMLAKVAVALALFALSNLALAGGAYYLFVTRETERPNPVLTEVTPKAPDPNIPILQKDPIAEIHKFRADEYDREHSYSHWVDGDGKQSLRIPISRAMEIIKSRGPSALLPAAGAAGTVNTAPVGSSPSAGPPGDGELGSTGASP